MRWVGALLPIAMTLAVVGAGAEPALRMGGIYREADEGTAAHLFQILLPAQIPIIVVFGLTQLEQHRTWTVTFLALQVGAAAALVAAVFALGL